MGPRPERGTGHAEDPWCLDLNQDPRLKALYLDAEHHDGYRRDQDVFGPGITIEDTMSVLVDYRGGATLTYSLNAHSPWEGYKVTVNGTAGRAELSVVERGAVELDEDGRAVLDPSATPGAFAGDVLRPIGDHLLVQKHWERATEHAIPAGIGGHGGGDASLFRPHDHVWHKGIAWSLPDVGPHNFWGGPNYVHGQGYVQLENDGSMDHDRFTAMAVDDDGVRVAHDLVWHAQPTPGQAVGDEVVRESRSFGVTVPAATEGVLVIAEAKV